MSDDLDDDDLAGIPCARSGRLAPITADELTGGSRGKDVYPKTIKVSDRDLAVVNPPAIRLHYS